MYNPNHKEVGLRLTPKLSNEGLRQQQCLLQAGCLAWVRDLFYYPRPHGGFAFFTTCILTYWNLIY